MLYSSCIANFNLQVARQTLTGRGNGLHVSRSDFAKSRQLLKLSEEVAEDWLAHQSGAACPLHSRDLRVRVTGVTGEEDIKMKISMAP